MRTEGPIIAIGVTQVRCSRAGLEQVAWEGLGWVVCVILLFPLFLLGNGRLKEEVVPGHWGNR